MCGRFAILSPAPELLAAFGAEGGGEHLAKARYNVAPSQQVPVLRNALPRVFAPLRWGLVPAWAKDPSIGNRLINARAETLAEKPAFRAAYRARRCLVPADGFYEWRREGQGRRAVKQAYFIRRRDRRPLALAGLWEGESFTVVTCAPNALMAPIHDRMPVLLPPEAWGDWLDAAPRAPTELGPLLVPAPAGELEAVPVSSLVNSPANDGPSLLEPLTR
ncbi:MAG TPA: SOS response-associated peptidase [Myxococcota bacterium]|nr:SOS response-associated peptidase [Myxococcota bacterium]HRY96773.1 SOS response-associated peptidase [Myxococcota bacterium]HSA23466.1 SOS response-associated peptidase [Myxococcota bacterium]